MKEVALNDGTKLTIGRNKNNDISIADKKASGNHAVIFYTNDGAFINDIDSSNGTYVDGKKVVSRQLQDNSKITIGDTKLVYVQGQLFVDDSKVSVVINQQVGANHNQAALQQSVPSVQKKPNRLKQYFGNQKQKNEYNKQMKNANRNKTPKVFLNKKLMAIVASTLVFVLLLVILIPNFNQTKQAIKSDFIPIDQTPSLEELMLGSTFYYVPMDIPTEKNQQYSKYMTVLASDAIDASDMLMDSYADVKKDIFEIYSLLSELIIECDKSNGTNYLSNKEFFGEVEGLHSNFEICELMYHSYEVDDYGDLLVNTEVISQKLILAQMAGENATDSLLTLASASAIIINENHNSDNRKIKKQIKDLDKYLSKTKSYENIQKISICTNVINDIARLANIAKVEVELESIQYAKTIMPQVENNITLMRQNNVFNLEEQETLEYAYEAIIELIDESEPYMNEYMQALSYDIDYTYYVFDSVLITYASAGWGFFGSSVDVSSAIKAETLEKNSGGLWQGFKNHVSDTVTGVAEVSEAVLNHTVKVAKSARQIVGYTADFAGGMVHTASSLTMAAIDSDYDVADAFNDIARQQQKRADDWNNGRSGADIFSGGLEDFEVLSDALAMSITGDKSFNSGYARGGINVGVSILGSLFTGTSKLLNADSTTGDLISGGIDIIGSLWGGSTNVFKATSAGTKALKGLKSFLNRGAALGFKPTVKKVAIESGKKLSKEITKNLGKNIKNIAKEIKKTFKGNTEELFAGNWRKIGGDLKKLFSPKTAKYAKAGYTSMTQQAAKNRLKGCVVTAATEVVDNLTAGFIDGKLNKLTADYIDGKYDSALSLFAKKWSIGTLKSDDGTQMDLSNIIDTKVNADGNFTDETIKMLADEGVPSFANGLSEVMLNDDLMELDDTDGEVDTIYEDSEEAEFEEWTPEDGAEFDDDENNSINTNEIEISSLVGTSWLATDSEGIQIERHFISETTGYWSYGSKVINKEFFYWNEGAYYVVENDLYLIGAVYVHENKKLYWVGGTTEKWVREAVVREYDFIGYIE